MYLFLIFFTCVSGEKTFYRGIKIYEKGKLVDDESKINFIKNTINLSLEKNEVITKDKINKLLHDNALNFTDLKISFEENEDNEKNILKIEYEDYLKPLQINFTDSIEYTDNFLNFNSDSNLAQKIGEIITTSPSFMYYFDGAERLIRSLLLDELKKFIYKPIVLIEIDHQEQCVKLNVEIKGQCCPITEIEYKGNCSISGTDIKLFLDSKGVSGREGFPDMFTENIYMAGEDNFKNPLFIKSKIKKIKTNVIEMYKSSGYLDAQCCVFYEVKDNKCKIILDITEGKQYKFGSFEIYSNDANIDIEEIKKIFYQFQDQPITETTQSKINEILNEKFNITFSTRGEESSKTGVFKPYIMIESLPSKAVESIEFADSVDVDENYIRSLIPVQENKPFCEKDIKETAKQLRQLNIFDDNKVEVEEDSQINENKKEKLQFLNIKGKNKDKKSIAFNFYRKNLFTPIIGGSISKTLNIIIPTKLNIQGSFCNSYDYKTFVKCDAKNKYGNFSIENSEKCTPRVTLNCKLSEIVDCTFLHDEKFQNCGITYNYNQKRNAASLTYFTSKENANYFRINVEEQPLDFRFFGKQVRFSTRIDIFQKLDIYDSLKGVKQKFYILMHKLFSLLFSIKLDKQEGTKAYFCIEVNLGGKFYIEIFSIQKDKNAELKLSILNSKMWLSFIKGFIKFSKQEIKNFVMFGKLTIENWSK